MLFAEEVIWLCITATYVSYTADYTGIYVVPGMIDFFFKSGGWEKLQLHVEKLVVHRQSF